MRHTDGMEEVRITAPGPRMCPVCATLHDVGDPHDRDSLYYQNLFYKKHKRFPTWQDAMRHCSESEKRKWRKRLELRGVSLDAPAGEDGERGQ